MSSTSGNYKPPSPEEVSVLGAVFSVVVVCLFGVGLYLIYLSFGQPPAKAELVARARWIGTAMVLGSIAVKFRWVLDVLLCLDRLFKRYIGR